MTLAIVGCSVLSISAPMIGRWRDVPDLADVLPVLSLVLPLTAISLVSDSLLRKRLALDRVSQAEVIGGVVTLPVTFGCALAGLGVWTLVVGALLPQRRAALLLSYLYRGVPVSTSAASVSKNSLTLA
jgi:O-antigen/teichoic acid export membrane protein